MPSRTSAFVRWLQLKRYHYEVTFPLYMFTPAEKFIFSDYSPTPYTPPFPPQNIPFPPKPPTYIYIANRRI